MNDQNYGPAFSMLYLRTRQEQPLQVHTTLSPIHLTTRNKKLFLAHLMVLAATNQKKMRLIHYKPTQKQPRFSVLRKLQPTNQGH